MGYSYTTLFLPALSEANIMELELRAFTAKASHWRESWKWSKYEIPKQSETSNHRIIYWGFSFRIFSVRDFTFGYHISIRLVLRILFATQANAWIHISKESECCQARLAFDSKWGVCFKGTWVQSPWRAPCTRQALADAQLAVNRAERQKRKG